MALIEPAQNGPENGSGGRWTAPRVDDHAGQAAYHLGRAQALRSRVGVRETEHTTIATAQVHATLYLAEQQRLANLIALALAPAGISALFFSRALGLGPEARSLEDLADEIRKGLYPDDNA